MAKRAEKMPPVGRVHVVHFSFSFPQKKLTKQHKLMKSELMTSLSKDAVHSSRWVPCVTFDHVIRGPRGLWPAESHERSSQEQVRSVSLITAQKLRLTFCQNGATCNNSHRAGRGTR